MDILTLIANPKFPLGQVVITANAQARLDPLAVRHALSRHAAGDWGDICDEDRGLNEEALKEGDRLLSVYGNCGQTFWIITESDRSSTTVLLPEDY